MVRPRAARSSKGGKFFKRYDVNCVASIANWVESPVTAGSGKLYTDGTMAQTESTRRRQGGAGPTGTGAMGSVREIPDKLYFRIGEVAKLCEVPAYVLRFWESEFPQLKPNKGGTGQRLYRRRDVEMALRVKALLYDEGYTIAGARQAFKAEARKGAPALVTAAPADAGSGESSQPEAAPSERRALLALRKEMQELHTMLSRPSVGRTAVQPIRAPRALSSTVHPGPVPMPAPTPFARPRLLTAAKPPARPAEPGLFDRLSTTE